MPLLIVSGQVKRARPHEFERRAADGAAGGRYRLDRPADHQIRGHRAHSGHPVPDGRRFHLATLPPTTRYEIDVPLDVQAAMIDPDALKEVLRRGS